MGAPTFGNTVSDAETVRLRSEMKMLAKRDAWTGVDRAFRAAHALQPELTFDDYLLGAFAAQALGDLATTRSVYSQRMHCKKTKRYWTGFGTSIPNMSLFDWRQIQVTD